MNLKILSESETIIFWSFVLLEISGNTSLNPKDFVGRDAIGRVEDTAAHHGLRHKVPKRGPWLQSTNLGHVIPMTSLTSGEYIWTYVCRIYF